MITPSQIYWLAKLDDIRELLSASGMIGGLSVAALILSAIAATGEVSEDTSKSIHGHCKKAWIALSLSLASLTLLGLANAFIPSTKQMAAIVVIPRIANSETVSDLGDLGKDLVGLAKERVEEMRPKKKEAK